MIEDEYEIMNESNKTAEEVEVEDAQEESEEKEGDEKETEQEQEQEESQEQEKERVQDSELNPDIDQENFLIEVIYIL